MRRLFFNSHTKKRHAFTLIELLVVLAIVALFVGLTLAAVHRVRSSAARAACADRLRQVALAMHQYHDIHHSLPPGTAHPILAMYRPPHDPYPLLHWPARLLPYLEQDAIWREIHAGYLADQTDLPLRSVSRRQITMLNCPADSPRSLPNPFRRPGPTSFLGVAGITLTRQDGVMYLDSYMRLASITDGHSNTLMIGERPPSIYGERGRFLGGWGNWAVGDAYLGVEETFIPLSSLCNSRPAAPFAPTTIADPCAPYHFWSLHPGGAHFAFADGSVRFLSYNVGPILVPLATRSGGEVISSDS